MLYLYEEQPNPQTGYSLTLHCYNIHDHAYTFEISCLRYPRGVVQSRELPEDNRHAITVPPFPLNTTPNNTKGAPKHMC